MNTYLKNIVAFAVENHDALVEVVVLHGTCGVKNRQRAFCFCLEGIIGTSVVQIVT